MGYSDNEDKNYNSSGYDTDDDDFHKGRKCYKKDNYDDDDYCDNETTTGINAGVAYFIWLIVFLVLLWLLRAIGIKWFSTVVFALIVSTFILSLFYPLEIVDGKYVYRSQDALFALIHLITWVLAIIYVIWKVFSDREDHYEQANWSWWNGNGYQNNIQGMPQQVTGIPQSAGGISQGINGIPQAVGGIPQTVGAASPF